MYKPTSYQFIQIENDLVKLFGGWSDAWRCNSGCAKIEEQDGKLIIHGYSGSIYEVNIDTEGLHAYPNAVLEGMITKTQEFGVSIKRISYQQAIEIVRKQ